MEIQSETPTLVLPKIAWQTALPGALATPTNKSRIFTTSTPLPTQGSLFRYVIVPRRNLDAGILYDDEDILAYDFKTETWRIFFDGSDVGLRQTALSGFRFLPDGRLLLSVSQPVKLSAVGHVKPVDILEFSPLIYGEVTDGRFNRYLGATTGVTDTEAFGDFSPDAGPEVSSCPNGPWRIMPLGDSITPGAGGTDVNGYRRRLYNLLAVNDYVVDFVGSQANGTPDYDTDNEGHGGWQAAGGESGGISKNIYPWLMQNPADFILLHIGTNDIGLDDYSASEVEDILNEIDRFNPEIEVLLALITNRFPYSVKTEEFNRSVRVMAEARLAAGDKITIVDMENALVYPDDLFDQLHPNDWGYFKMADAWFEALIGLIERCKP